VQVPGAAQRQVAVEKNVGRSRFSEFDAGRFDRKKQVAEPDRKNGAMPRPDDAERTFKLSADGDRGIDGPHPVGETGGRDKDDGGVR
jgi:hypothetical protein